jgi:hypothetical protein
VPDPRQFFSVHAPELFFACANLIVSLFVLFDWLRPLHLR